MTMNLSPEHPCFTTIRRRRDLLADGYTDSTLRMAVKAGVLHRIRHGAYVDGHVWLSLDQAAKHALLARAALGSARTRSVISHVSALPFHEAPVWGFDLAEAHLTREDHKAGRHESGVQQHRGIVLPEDVMDVHGLRVMSATRTALELTTLDQPEAALVAICFLLHSGRTTADALLARLDQSITLWPDTLSTRRILRLADRRIESPAEARFVHLCWRTGVPLPEPQVEVRDHNGRFLGRVDFAWRQFGVFVEIDGREKYVKHLREGESAADAVVREKRREDRIRAATGWRCLRLTWADLATAERTAARIRAVLAGLAA
ncbi:type IV toxin-antitoxin system AbiEi family antitoxin domain-containing protein [Nocardioides sp. BP30]|uniref:type IV toxin-antitoxin system AbiEi family antitoxin domain-containing protein n=1 Tax=Nocardioides sp. BP30 TaxID=3036374 RepID=UPI0024690D57|nr:type IV toxin-antitoxin system AbiEi family antitoxin domain-containing protein [Nocardioides sp. BP30]WGL52928.1 type IV toxin-antitoxin system AbiEi family antitoxin domain-containing protein [Nocardioides sp. BP30]